jgi:hypothetical protein
MVIVLPSLITHQKQLRVLALIFFSMHWCNFVLKICNFLLIPSKKGIIIMFMYEVWQKSNATGNAVHELTMLLPPPSHGN